MEDLAIAPETAESSKIALPQIDGLVAALDSAPGSRAESPLSDLPSDALSKGPGKRTAGSTALNGLKNTDGNATDTGNMSANEASALPNATLNAPLSRAKRVRTAIKFSTAKGPKAASGRRAAATIAAGNIANTGKNAAAAMLDDDNIPNNDYCDTCGGKGHFLCCDGCPRSFHFSCLDPPLEFNEIPVESWYCNVCNAARGLPIAPEGIFGPLILKVECENPTTFQLPKDIKTSFRNVITGSYGEYVDSNEFRPLSQLGKSGKSGYEERDPYKLKDKQGKTVLCHKCHEPANQQKQKKIIACDFCELHWHLDCCDPPMVALPGVTRKWKCPIHADGAVAARKALKNPKIVKVKHAKTQNNGDIDIIPTRVRASVKHAPEEFVSQGIRYQVPEQIVILDFWSRLKRDKYGLPFDRVNRDVTPPLDAFDFSDDSSLTSIEPSPERDLGPSMHLSDGHTSLAEPSTSALSQRPSGSGSAAMDRVAGTSAQSDLTMREEREGTEISDGDPPDFGDWDALKHDYGSSLVPETSSKPTSSSSTPATKPVSTQSSKSNGAHPQSFVDLLSAAGLDTTAQKPKPQSVRVTSKATAKIASPAPSMLSATSTPTTRLRSRSPLPHSEPQANTVTSITSKPITKIKFKSSSSLSSPAKPTSSAVPGIDTDKKDGDGDVSMS